MANAHDLLMAQRAAMMGKSGYTAKDYVQNGLIAMWDGIENAGWGVHDPNATVWKDLISNRLPNVGSVGDDFIESQGKRFTFDGGVFVKDEATLEAVLINISGENAVFSFNSSAGENFYGFDAFGRTYVRRMVPNNKIGNVYIDTLKRFNFCAKYENGEAVFFANGQIKDTVLYTTKINGRQEFSVLTWSGNSANAKWSQIRIYNRALSSKEIAANYEIDKARFNLPDAA